MIANCVVVTYNRLNLLKECLAALEQQTFPLNRIIIVDNCSTDDTPEYLSSLSDNPLYRIIRTERNIGGAGGFSLGLKESVLSGCDYTWMMDDDTIADKDALKCLVAAADGNDIGFVCSRVDWTDGKPHIMNKPNLNCSDRKDMAAKTVGDGIEAVPCRTCSFVSVMISSEAVYKVGLPIKEFFIWCDDVEYTERIYSEGFRCYYVPESKVLHKTTSNYYPSIDLAPANTAGRFYYQARNTCYLKHRKQRNRILFWFSVLNKYRVYKHKLKRRKADERKEFLEAVKRGCKDGLTFFPEIEYIKRN